MDRSMSLKKTQTTYRPTVTPVVLAWSCPTLSEVVIAGEVLEGSDMIGKVLRERQRGARQPGNPWSQCTVEALHLIRLAGQLEASTVLGGENDPGGALLLISPLFISASTVVNNTV